MKRRNTKKLALCIVSAIICVFTIFLLSNNNKRKCMNLPIISYEQLKEYKETTSLDISKMTFEGERVAVDYFDQRIYISQSKRSLEHYYTLQGKFVPMSEEYSLYFLDTPELYDIEECARNDRGLQLIIIDGEHFQKVDVIITTLPVLNLKFEYEELDEYGTHRNTGKFTLWNNMIDTSTYETVSSLAEWHIRGNSSKSYPKKAWKLNLKDPSGENNKLNLAGLGYDDDWIMNPMSMDDTKIKEKLAQVLWKDIVAETDYNYKMSSGEYVEVLINGAYQGLYLLQRKVDEKYLGLDTNTDILLKGKNIWETETIQEGYEIIYSPLDSQSTYDKLELALQNKMDCYVNLDNFIDVTLFLQFLSANDNQGYKNMFYALDSNRKGYELSWIPWDTDLSFGVTWGYSYEESLTANIERQELHTIRKCQTDLDELITQRWKELRKTTYEEESIVSVCDELYGVLSTSGALQRDTEHWGNLHDGQDHLENLKIFIHERLDFLDEYYEQ